MQGRSLAGAGAAGAGSGSGSGSGGTRQMQGRSLAGEGAAGAGSESSTTEERRGQPKPVPGASNKIQVCAVPGASNNIQVLSVAFVPKQFDDPPHRNHAFFGLRVRLLLCSCGIMNTILPLYDTGPFVYVFIQGRCDVLCVVSKSTLYHTRDTFNQVFEHAFR